MSQLHSSKFGRGVNNIQSLLIIFVKWTQLLENRTHDTATVNIVFCLKNLLREGYTGAMGIPFMSPPVTFHRALSYKSSIVN